MAEGDTILRLARRIEAKLAGQVLSAAAPNPRGRAAGVERLDGKRLERAAARGKHLLLHFDGLVLHSHLGMSGGWHLYDRGAAWRRSRAAAWAVLAGAEREAVQFGGTTLRVLPVDRLQRDPQLARLGPDILAVDFDPGPAIAALRAEPDRALGDALLDQRLLAGVGNIFKSEGCFAAAVDPWRRLGDLSAQELEAVLWATREEMLKAVATGRHAPRVYRRRGPCPRCGARLLARGQGDANRTTYWCPGCQH
jgi:endonuclease VIII